MRRFFREVYMDSVFPILNSAELPPYIWGNDEREKVRIFSSHFQNIAPTIVFSVALNVSYLFNAAQNSNVCRMKGIGVSLLLLWKFKKRILYIRQLDGLQHYLTLAWIRKAHQRTMFPLRICQSDRMTCMFALPY